MGDENALVGGVDEDWLRDGGGQFQRTNEIQGCTIHFDTSAHRRHPLGVGRTRDGESHDASRAMPGGIYARCNVDAPFFVGYVARCLLRGRETPTFFQRMKKERVELLWDWKPLHAPPAPPSLSTSKNPGENRIASLLTAERYPIRKRTFNHTI